MNEQGSISMWNDLDRAAASSVGAVISARSSRALSPGEADGAPAPGIAFAGSFFAASGGSPPVIV
jgi:hypothetical protein